MSERPGFDVVVAADEDGGIGARGDLPWRLPGDMKHFVAVTRGSGDDAVVMGRRTWESIPPRFRPLPGRRNVVLSRSADARFDGAERAGSLGEALALAASAAAVHVIGGGEIFAEALAHPRCEEVYLTRVHARFECDTRLPALAPRFARAEVLGEGEDGGVRYTFERWART